MLIVPKYSLIIYCPEMYIDNLEYIEKCLIKGVIVHLFLGSTFSEEIELNEYDSKIFDIAIQNKLLFIYEDQYDLKDDYTLIALDNKILDQEVYNKICNVKDIEFNHQQYGIITAPTESNIIVVSGAGTGKTTTMINRLIYLRKTQSDFTFEKAALITFTNKASRDMRERLIQLLERYYKVTRNSIYLDMMDEVTKCQISTIHGFSKRLINEYGKNIRINKNIQVRSFIYKRKNAITEALNRVYKDDRELYQLIKYYPIYEVENKINRIWDKLDNYSIDVNSPSYNVLFGEDSKNFSVLVGKVIAYAQQILENTKENEFEISDLMKKLAYKDLFKDVKDKYSLVMVDEFQDSDNIQIEFVANFCRETNCNLIVVGDEKQSIYRFRGAEYTAFNRLEDLLKTSNKSLCKYTMVRNYRTDAQLLEDINKMFIAIDKKLECFNYKKEDYIYSLVNKCISNKIEFINYEENEELAQFYSNLLDDKNEGESVAVLLRSNNDIKDFKEFCDRHNILCRVDVTGGFYRHESVKDFYIMLKALIDFHDNRTTYSFINTPYINKVIDKNIILKGNLDEQRDYLEGLLVSEEWNRYRDKTRVMNPLNLIDEILKQYNPVKSYYRKILIEARKTQKNYKKIAYIKALEYKLNLEHLIYLIKESFSENITSIYQIEQFLKIKIATDNSVDAKKTDDKYDTDFIQCLTVHKSKGLEYDYVVLQKLTNKFISYKDVDVILRTNGSDVSVGYRVNIGDDEYKNDLYVDYLKDEKNEIIGEESRLLYVAMTRCKKKLILNMNNIAATEVMNSWKSLIGVGVYSNV